MPLPSMLNTARTKEYWVPAVFFFILAALFGPACLNGSGNVLSAPDSDTYRQFYAWREFAFGELRHGHLVLWNPHNYSGTPFLASFQAGLLYPPNWVHLVLSTAAGINFVYVLHLFLLGCFTYRWIRDWDLSPASAGLAALGIMLSGHAFLAVFGGHLSNISSMAWTPLILWSVDRAVAREFRRALLTAAFALAMQILAGHVQYVYYTLFTAALYAILRLLPRRKEVGYQAPLALIAALFFAAALSAAQLWPALSAGSETLRGNRLPYEFAQIYSFPVENLLTYLAPAYLGDLQPGAFPYWGKCWLGEMCPFQGRVTLILALCALFWGRGETRRVAGPLFVFLVLLALGGNTPLHWLFYEILPGFGNFRGPSKFLFPASLMLALLAAEGFEFLIAKPRSEKAKPIPYLAGGVAVFGAVLIVLGASLRGGSPLNSWFNFVTWVGSGPGAGNTSQLVGNVSFITNSANNSGTSFLWAGGIILVAAALLGFRGKWPCSSYALAGLAAAEMLFFTSQHVITFPVSSLHDSNLADAEKLTADGSRIANVFNPNSSMVGNYSDVWGTDPVLLRRYGEFMSALQGVPPDNATQELSFIKVSPLVRIVRCKSIVGYTASGPIYFPIEHPLPRALLFRNYQFESNRDDIFRAMGRHDFKPESTVIIEQGPDPLFQISKVPPTEPVKVIDISTDELLLETDIKSPAILLLTDAYSKNWYAEETGDRRQSYQVIPADYCLRAITLPAGKHRIRMYYAPPAVKQGFILSLAAWIALLGLVLQPLRKPRQQEPTG